MARALERKAWLLRRSGEIMVELQSAGTEAVQAAAAAALRIGVDWVVPDRHDLVLCLANGLTPFEVMLALFGRAGDPTSGGRQQGVGFSSRRAHLVSTSASVAARVTHAAGLAYASRHRGLAEVVLVSTPSSAMASGDWHEGLNFAAVHRLPLVLLTQGDSAAVGSPPPAAEVAAGYGIDSGELDGASFSRARATFGWAVAHARTGKGPVLLRATVPRLTSARSGGGVLPRDQLEAQAHDDPIERMRTELAAGHVLDAATNQAIRTDCVRVVEDVTEVARAAPPPAAAAALDNVLEQSHG